jgi:hypothetical protein
MFTTKRLIALVLLSGAATTALATEVITGTKDFGGATIGTACDGQSESQQPVLLVRDGGTVRNVKINAKAADGIHCEGNCRLENVTWQDVCEDAATMLGGSGKTMTVTGGSAAAADDKAFQHNGKGSTVNISNFALNGSNGKLYRSCGDCSANGGPRKVNISNVTVNGTVKTVAGVNANYGDVATIRTLRVKGYKAGKPKLCEEYIGVVKGNGSSKSQGEKFGTAACNVRTTDVTSF